MARRSLEDRTVRKLSKIGNGSYYVTLPIEYVRDLKWQDNQKLRVHKSGKKLIIEDWQG